MKKILLFTFSIIAFASFKSFAQKLNDSTNILLNVKASKLVNKSKLVETFTVKTNELNKLMLTGEMLLVLQGVDTNSPIYKLLKINLPVKIYDSVNKTIKYNITNLFLSKLINKSNSEIEIKLNDADTTENSKYFLIKLEIKVENKTEKIENSLLFLNAYNFDFLDTKLNSNYVGHLNLFSPNLGESRWGINTGILKIDFFDNTYNSNNIRNNEYFRIDNVKVNPLDIVKDSTKYLRQFNKYKMESRISSWSMYAQPLYEVLNFKKQHIYLNGHIEFLAENYSITTRINTQQQDTALVVNSQPIVLRSNLADSSTYNYSTLSFCFGLGATFDLNLTETCKFFGQYNLGIYSNEQQYLINEKNYFNSINSFYLIRVYFKQQINDKSSLVVGTDFRGNAPFTNVKYAAYAGLNIGLDSFVGLFK
jgi:hypothetical protein